MSLAQKQEQIFDDLKEFLGVLAAKAPVADLGEVYEGAEDCFHALACCHLLRHTDTRRFCQNLIWAAMARRHFLLRSEREDNVEDFHRARSRSDGAFCAIAAGDWALAAELGERCARTYMRDGEYEEDFAYHYLIHLLVTSEDQGGLRVALESYKRTMSRATERLAVCVALCTRDGTAFDSAFSKLVSARAVLVDEERATALDRPTFEPKSRLFVEGFALLRLAERRGIMVLSREYPPLCPSFGTVEPLRKRPDDIFDEL